MLVLELPSSLQAPAGGGAAGVGEGQWQNPGPPFGSGTPAARRYLLVPFSLRVPREKELADGCLFGYRHGALVYAAALSQNVG